MCRGVIGGLSSVGQRIRLITDRSRVRVPEGPPSSCDKKDISRFCRIKSKENGLLGIIPKSPFSFGADEGT